VRSFWRPPPDTAPPQPPLPPDQELAVRTFLADAEGADGDDDFLEDDDDSKMAELPEDESNMMRWGEEWAGFTECGG
jgi:hypothetical protein